MLRILDMPGKDEISIRVGLLVILLVTALFYAPSLQFGFIWDDPLWYERVAGRSIWKVLGPNPTYQFFRPTTLLINWLFARPDGTFPAVQMHAFQVGIHLLNVALIARLMRELGLKREALLTATALFALYPLQHQAIAWAAPQQPWVLCCMLVTAHLYLGARRRRSYRLLLAAVLVYILALTIQESAIQFLPFILLLEVHCVGRRQQRIWQQPALSLFATAALGYLVLWYLMPKAEHIRSVSFQAETGLYLLQGLAFPLLGRTSGDARALASWVLPLEILTLAWLVVTLLHQRRGKLLFWGLIWFFAQILSTWAGLDYSYVSLSSRTFYLGSFGAALLWTAALLPVPERSSPLRRRLGALTAALILLQSGLLIDRFNSLYDDGTGLLGHLVDQLAESDEDTELLFVNFPDRYTSHNAPYPLGYWGLTLAPAAVDLEDFGQLVHGHTPQTSSLALPIISHSGREESIYEVNMRGIEVHEPQLYEAMRHADATYLTEYERDGSMALLWAGDVRRESQALCPPALVRFGEVAALLRAESRFVEDRVEVYLQWYTLGPGTPEESLFITLSPLGDPTPRAESSGSPARGLLPFWVWQQGDVIEELRTLTPAEGDLPTGDYDVIIGIVNWETLERLPAYLPDGTRLPGDVFWIGTVRIGEKESR